MHWQEQTNWKMHYNKIIKKNKNSWQVLVTALLLLLTKCSRTLSTLTQGIDNSQVFKVLQNAKKGGSCMDLRRNLIP